MSKESEPNPKENGLFEPHPNLADEVNDAIVKSEILGGVNIDDLKVGRMLEIETENRIYTLEKRQDGYYISGHPEYCPEPVKVIISGSTWGGSILKVKFVGREMRLEFGHPDKKFGTIVTSFIKDIKEFPIPGFEPKK